MLQDHSTFQTDLDRFGQALIQSGQLTSAEFDRAKRSSEETGKPLLWVMRQLGLCSEEHMLETAAACLQLRQITQDDLPSEPALLDHFPLDFLKTKLVAPVIGLTGENLLVMSDPFDDETWATFHFKTGLDFQRVLLARDDLAAWLQSRGQATDADAAVALDSSTDQADLERLQDLAAGAPVVDWVERLMALAVEWGASDIHLDPATDGLLVRLRVDGQLIAPPMGDQPKADAVVSRLKLLAGLNIAERRMPQDGRIRTRISGKNIDIRIATIATLSGESLVLRLLDQSKTFGSLSEVGLGGPSLERLRTALGQPNGIVLVTGPTGSGKTTTLYAALQEMATPERKFISIEDPVEYEISGVTQVPVKQEIGFDFARSLRAMLRHDPNVIMVGEIRDLETAAIAIEASLTGHQVLSTLHTNSAVGTITRLLEMGVEGYLLASSLRAITAQRLVRRLCVSCKVAGDTPHHVRETLARELGATPVARIAAPTGCPKCRNTGYSGRLCITEVLPITPAVQRAVIEGASETEVSETALAEGMETLRQSGLRAAVAGVTTYEEIVRVVGLGVSK